MDKNTENIRNTDFWSIYDEQFAISDLHEIIKRREEESDKVVDSIQETIKKIFQNDPDEHTRLVVDKDVYEDALHQDLTG